jgi:hypothetical protein
LEKTINGRQPGKKQTDKETTLEKTINGRQPGKKQTDKETTLEKIINGRQPDKKQTDKETTLEKTQEITPRRTGNKCESIERQTRTRRKNWAKTRNYPKTNGEQRLVCRKAYELLLKEYCMNSDNLGNSDRAGGCPWELRQVSFPKL